MLGIKKPLKVTDPHNYKHKVRTRGCTPKREEEKGNKDMHRLLNICDLLKQVLH